MKITGNSILVTGFVTQKIDEYKLISVSMIVDGYKVEVEFRELADRHEEIIKTLIKIVSSRKPVKRIQF